MRRPGGAAVAALRPSLAAALLAALLAGACAPALRTPPDLLEMAGRDRPPPASYAPDLLAKAEALYARRDPADVERAAALFLDAATADPSRPEGVIGAARARIWLVEREPDAETRKRLATSAVQAAQWCDRIAPGDSRCDYWLGAALGVQARERKATGLDALPRIEAAFRRAAASSPDLEEGGPDRALALLYARAPGWPRGPGDPGLALEHARKAAAIAPDYPPNVLALAEALAGTGEQAGARETWQRALDLARRSADPDAGRWACEADRALGRPCADETP